jgi:YihY family inner membrane protein
LIAVSLAATLVRGFAIDVGQGLGVPGEVINAILDAGGVLFPLALSMAVYTVVYVVVPARRVRVRDVWPGVLFAAVVYEVAKRGFAIYVENYSNYNAVYGSLGAVIAFLVFVYIAAIVFLIGAEMAALWPRVRAGVFDTERGPPMPLHRRVLLLLRSLVIRDRAGQGPGST